MGANASDDSTAHILQDRPKHKPITNKLSHEKVTKSPIRLVIYPILRYTLYN